jgi:hypothetical protein
LQPIWLETKIVKLLSLLVASNNLRFGLLDYLSSQAAKTAKQQLRL